MCAYVGAIHGEGLNPTADVAGHGVRGIDSPKSPRFVIVRIHQSSSGERNRC